MCEQGRIQTRLFKHCNPLLDTTVSQSNGNGAVAFQSITHFLAVTYWTEAEKQCPIFFAYWLLKSISMITSQHTTHTADKVWWLYQLLFKGVTDKKSCISLLSLKFAISESISSTLPLKDCTINSSEMGFGGWISFGRWLHKLNLGSRTSSEWSIMVDGPKSFFC